MVFRSTLRPAQVPPGGRPPCRRARAYQRLRTEGRAQLVCDHLEPQGYGPLQLAFEQLKKKLAAEGLFDTARKRPLPALPRQIGIVTSIDGAALRDIVRVLRRRYPNAHLVIAPTRVQGDGAAADIARALRLVSRLDAVDVIIVGRGGGSLEDLWAFNEEAVARAIATCPVPVISPAGHETDVTIADFVADLRAPTPSATAKLVVRRKDEFAAHIDRLAQRLGAAARSAVRRLESRLLVALARPGMSGLRARLAWRTRHAAERPRPSSRRRARGCGDAAGASSWPAALDQFDPRHRLGRVGPRSSPTRRDCAQAMAGRRHALTRAQGRPRGSTG